MPDPNPAPPVTGSWATIREEATALGNIRATDGGEFLAYSTAPDETLRYRGSFPTSQEAGDALILAALEPGGIMDGLPRERHAVGADGCGCQITEELLPGGTSIPGTQRVEHWDRCWARQSAHDPAPTGSPRFTGPGYLQTTDSATDGYDTALHAAHRPADIPAAGVLRPAAVARLVDHIAWRLADEPPTAHQALAGQLPPGSVVALGSAVYVKSVALPDPAAGAYSWRVTGSLQSHTDTHVGQLLAAGAKVLRLGEHGDSPTEGPALTARQAANAVGLLGLTGAGPDGVTPAPPDFVLVDELAELLAGQTTTTAEEPTAAAMRATTLPDNTATPTDPDTRVLRKHHPLAGQPYRPDGVTVTVDPPTPGFEVHAVTPGMVFGWDGHPVARADWDAGYRVCNDCDPSVFEPQQ